MRTNKSDIANRKITRQIIINEPHGIEMGINYSIDRQLLISCPICGTRFHRPPSHVERNKNGTYCSRACAGEALKIRVITHCVSCGKEMELTPNLAIRIKTCSKECSTLRRTKGKIGKKYNLKPALKIIKEIKKRGKCEKCGATQGPWVVRGVIGEVLETGVSVVKSNGAELWCRLCHLHGIQPLAIKAIKNRKMTRRSKSESTGK